MKEGRKERRKKGTEERDGGKERVREEGRKTEEYKLHFKRVTLNGAQH